MRGITGIRTAGLKLKLPTLFIYVLLLLPACSNTQQTSTKEKSVTAEFILGNPNYQAISYGGYRFNNRDQQPSLSDFKEDLKLLAALDIKLLRTYNVHFPHASNLLQAISELKTEDPDFEMYVMLGAWIDCKNAWTGSPDHLAESERNPTEIATAVELANKYPDIVKIIAVGNEAMVKWAAAYHVQANVILKWVTHLQELKSEGQLGKDVWITSSDNFASWGGGSVEYHTPDLTKLIAAVDFISMHTYPMHDTHYNSDFWNLSSDQSTDTPKAQIDASMARALNYAQNQYKAVVDYMKKQGLDKPVHIGETGWASFSNGFYGANGSKACDEYKHSVYYDSMRKWTNDSGISCFFFEAFDEPWKDAANSGRSENHFGLFTVDGQAKFVLWDEVDEGAFKNLKRNGNAITKSYNGKEDDVMSTSLPPPLK